MSAALQVQYLCEAGGLWEDQPGAQPGHSQLTEKGLWDCIFYYTQASSEGTRAKDPFFLCRLSQSIKPKASSVVA